jgi:hypothetical protein
MATMSTQEASDLVASEWDAASRRFERLARVRAHRRARRRNRVVLITVVVAALIGVGVLGLTSVRRTSATPSPVAATLAPPPMAPTRPSLPVAPTLATPPTLTAPPPTLTAPPPTLTAPPPRPPVATSARTGEGGRPRGERPGAPRAADAETDDGAAVIDWLLKTRSQ